MCRSNANCPKPEGFCTCPLAYQDKTSPAISSPNPLSEHLAGIMVLNQVIQKQAESFILIQEMVDKVFRIINQSTYPQMSIYSHSQHNVIPRSLLKRLYGENHRHEAELKILLDIPSTVYQDHAFPLSFLITGLDNNPIVYEQEISFQVHLFTSDSSPKRIITSNAGEQIIGGTVDARGSSEIKFPRVVIRQASSHFRRGFYYLVVCAIDNSLIKPFVLPNFVVKSRNPPHEEARKVPKIG